MRTLLDLARRSLKMNKEVTLLQHEILLKEQPDVVFFNQKCVFPVVWGMQHKVKIVFVHPFPCFLHPVDQHSIIGLKGGGNYGKSLNRLSYSIQSFILSLAIYFSTKKILNAHGTFKTSIFQIRQYLLKQALSHLSSFFLPISTS